MSQANASVADLSFEQALKELEEIVRGLEEGDTSLDASIDAYERGALLKKHCEEKLAQARARVDKITLSQDGAVGVEPADLT